MGPHVGGRERHHMYYRTSQHREAGALHNPQPGPHGQHGHHIQTTKHLADKCLHPRKKVEGQECQEFKYGT